MSIYICVQDHTLRKGSALQDHVYATLNYFLNIIVIFIYELYNNYHVLKHNQINNYQTDWQTAKTSLEIYNQNMNQYCCIKTQILQLFTQYYYEMNIKTDGNIRHNYCSKPTMI